MRKATKQVKIPLPVDLTDYGWTMLRHDFKVEGYGMVWLLLNRLASAPQYKLPHTLLSTIAAEHLIPEKHLNSVILSYGIFSYDETHFWYADMVPRQQKSIEPVEKATATVENYSEAEQASFQKFNAFLKANCPRVCQMQKQITIREYIKLIQSKKRDQIIKTLTDMENWKPLLSKRVSVYLTILTWTRPKEA